MHLGWQGYADAKPSESIQPGGLPGIAVAVVFPWIPSDEMLSRPVKQYKDYSERRTPGKARELATWLADHRTQGLLLAGFCNVHTQSEAAVMGLDLIQELPDTRVEPHFDSFRLHFGDDSVDFAQAVALQYYLFTIQIGVLRAGTLIPSEYRTLFVAMDRFPGAGTDGGTPGQPLPKTDGAQFLEFVQANSATSRGIAAQDQSINLVSKVGTLDWWRPEGDSRWRKGKTHPYFVLPDWLAAAGMATEFPDEFAESFGDEQTGHTAVGALNDLHESFKAFDIWSMTGSVSHIVASEQQWQVPDAAREFILERAIGNPASGS